MTKRSWEIVNLLPGSMPIVLPGRLAKVLRILIDAGDQGVNAFQLSELGCAAVHTTISDLRKRGAIIPTRRGLAEDATGATHSGMAYYTFYGWRLSSTTYK